MSNELEVYLDRLVEEIKLFQKNLYNLSDDELRLYFNKLQDLTNCNNTDSVLDRCLTKVFALVKETARRLSLRDMCFTVNSNDKSLSKDKNNDFIQIEGGKAIYHNHWLVRGIDTPWTMVHYDEQIKGGILLHRGFAVEMATGEGKTLVATLPVFLNAMSHKGVHVMTVNDYLSKRDFEITRPIYMMYGLSVDCIENYPLHSYRSGAYKCDITFGTDSSFTFDYLYDHLAVSTEDCVQQQFNFALIDELDSILIDDADEPHIVSSGNFVDNRKEYEDNKAIIEKLVDRGEGIMYVANKVKKEAEFTSEGKKWLSEKCNNPSLFRYSKSYQINNYINLQQEEKENIIKTFSLQNALVQLLRAYVVFHKDIDYIIDNGKVLIVDPHTGRIKPSSRWEHGLHTAIEVKEGVNPQLDSDSTAVISLKNYFRLYDKVAGMSGTLVQVDKELCDLYGLKVAVLPTHKPIIRKDFPLRIFLTVEAKDDAIIKEILKKHYEGRPVLVGCSTIVRSEQISARLKELGITFNLLNAKDLEKEAYLISLAGKEEQITVSTSISGRGTDIKLSKRSLECGGLAVIGAELLDSERVDRQLAGRAGRQGDPGSSLFFSSLEDDIIQFLNDKEQKELHQLVDNNTFDNLSTDEIRRYFYLAQQNRELYYREVRKKTALKDDTIAPFRKKFYQERNSVLYSSEQVKKILEKLPSSLIKWDKANENIKRLQDQTYELLKRERDNNKVEKYADIPFSENLHLFTIKLDIDTILADENAFNFEFKKQVILLSYDSFWKGFVEHINEDLDSKEIEQLPADFSHMMDKVNNQIANRLLNSTLPVIIRDVFPTGHKNKTGQGSLTKKKHTFSFDDPCPCGSGKKYSECHGRNIHHQRASGRR